MCRYGRNLRVRFKFDRKSTRFLSSSFPRRMALSGVVCVQALTVNTDRHKNGQSRQHAKKLDSKERTAL